MMLEMPFMVSKSGLTTRRGQSVAIRDPELPLAHPGAVHKNATDLKIECI